MNLDGLQPVPICPHLAALSIHPNFHPNFVRILSTLILYVRLLLADGYAECGRLLANVVIAYNSMVLSALLVSIPGQRDRRFRGNVTGCSGGM
jgi:hypothetical protein